MGYIAYGNGYIKIKADEQEDAFLAACTELADREPERWGVAWTEILAGMGGSEGPTDVVSLAIACDFEDSYLDSDTNSYRSVGAVDHDLIHLEHRDKYHDDMAEAFYAAIAPFVYEGVIDWQGEEDTYWRVRFRDGDYSTHQGKVVFPSDPGPADA